MQPLTIRPACPSLCGRGHLSLLVSSAALLLGSACSRTEEAAPADARQPAAYQVWAADQNGNTVYVMDRDGAVVRTLDFAGIARADRPHLLTPSPDGRLVFSANTASNSISIHNAADGSLVSTVDSVGKAPHVALPNHAGDRVYVFNIGPRATDGQGAPDKGETLTELVRQNGDWQIGRFLDLKAAPPLADDALFPSRRPVLGDFSADGRFLVVSFLTGGLAVVDLDSWSVTKAIGSDRVRQNVTNVVASPDRRELYVTAGNQQESWLYVLDATGEPELVASHDLSSRGQDAHGSAIDPVRRELWVVHRVSNNITIHPLDAIRQPEHNPASIPVGGVAPDFIALSPDGERAYLALRGPNPAPTIPFPLAGEKPGVVVLDVPNRSVLRVVDLGDPSTGDFHGVAIIRRQ